MTIERDTHFFGFAKLLVAQLEKNGFVTPVYGVRPYTLIAQAAYDLVVHALDTCPLEAFEITGNGVDYVPDLTAWPAEPER